MTGTVTIEKRKRGLFGWAFLLMFWGFNAFMAFALFAGLGETVGGIDSMGTDAERTGYAIGTAIGAGFLIFVWLAGAVILGLFALLTRGNKVLIERKAK